MGVLIVEGLTGTGKTSTIEAFRKIATFEHVDESVTFGDFVTDFSADSQGASSRAHSRMAAILEKIENDNRPLNYVLERFHFSQLALGSDWRWYRSIDQRCAALGARVAVLVLPSHQIARRSLYRAEHENRDWQNLIARDGSERNALLALQAAQSARLMAIDESDLERRTIDTSEKMWPRYADEIARWLGWA